MSVIPAGDYVTLTDGATVSTDASLGVVFYVTGSRAARTMSNPTNPTTGQEITYKIENAGGPLTTTWGSAFKLAGVYGEPEADRARTITFLYDGTSWIETGRSGDALRLYSTPADVASLIGWWDANTFSLADADPVTSWRARAGPNLSVISGNEPTFKTSIQNSRPVVRFDGTNDYLKAALNPMRGYQSASVFAVFAKGDTSSVVLRTVVDIAGTGNDGLIFFENEGNIANRVGSLFGSGGAFDNNLASSVGTAFHQWSWIVGTGTQPSLYKDAGSAITPAGGRSAGFAAITQASLYVGANVGNQRFMSGDLAELILYSTALNGTDRATVATYLKNKWGTP